MTFTEQERLLALEINHTQMVKDVQEIKQDVKDINTKMDSLIEKLEWKFASKWVERVMKWLVWLVLLTVFGAVVAQVIAK